METSDSNRARSWLLHGRSIDIEAAQEGDIVIIKSAMDDPGSDVIRHPGLVGFYVTATSDGNGITKYVKNLMVEVYF